jgi:hypothetical protein
MGAVMSESEAETSGFSEFGAGLIYPICLFLKHAEREMFGRTGLPKNEAWSMWWYGAADHLMEMHIPPDSVLGKAFADKARKLHKLACEYRLPMGPRTDFHEKALEAIALAEELAFEIDVFLGAAPVKAIWK